MRTRTRRRIWPALLRAFAVAALVAATLSLPRPGAAKPSLEALQAVQEAFVEVAERVKPAVVNINTTQKARPPRRPQVDPFFRGPFREFFGDDFFERFFREGPRRDLERRSLGSGVIIDQQGFILTNNHVIERADEIQVTLSDKRTFKAKVVGTDPKTDLAVIRIEKATGLTPARLGDSDRIRIGEWAIAIGNPFGLSQTVTVGVISATGRSNVGITAYEDFIQTDASINPGNSGGPLLNVRGEVLGINTAIVAAGQGIGFAIPINMAKGIKDMLIAQGRVVRGWLGVQIQSLTEDLAAQFGVKPDEGVLIANVLKDGPAEKGGLKAGDVVLEVDGAKVTGVSQLQRLVAAVPPGKQVNLKVRREGGDLFLTLAVGEMPAEEPVAAAVPDEQGAARYGFKVQDLTPELREQFGLKETGGVVVSELDPEGPAARTGLRAGDVILEVGRQRVRNSKEFVAAVRRAGEKGILLRVWRDGGSQFVVIHPEKG
ncbi:MAG TPA: DegQ family serine endoprotease [Candidatus Methylomirabilis sp.]|jgi:serine protease Do|nr:DegQ family serine endoprotease [Candidatus Methylomirabilis sp.]